MTSCIYISLFPGVTKTDPSKRSNVIAKDFDIFLKQGRQRFIDRFGFDVVHDKPIGCDTSELLSCAWSWTKLDLNKDYVPSFYHPSGHLVPLPLTPEIAKSENQIKKPLSPSCPHSTPKKGSESVTIRMVLSASNSNIESKIKLPLSSPRNKTKPSKSFKKKSVLPAPTDKHLRQTTLTEILPSKKKCSPDIKKNLNYSFS